MSYELKPCPFCGSKNLVTYLEKLGDCVVYCVDCYENSSNCHTPKMNIDDWNTRPIEDELRAEVERLKAERRWIPVSERKPCHYLQAVLFYDAFRDLILCGFHNPRVPQWEGRDGYYYHGNEYQNVTHWMEKPEPPESEEE